MSISGYLPGNSFEFLTGRGWVLSCGFTCMRRRSIFSLGIAAVLLCSVTLRSEIIHRYTFDLDAGDSVGTAHGTLEGGAFIETGGVVLDPALQSYVNLPGDLITGAEALTIEAWASFGDNAGWARLYDFGDQNPDSGNGRYYIMFTPHSGPNDTRMSISDADPGYNNEQLVTRPGNLDNQGLVHIVAVYEPTANSMRLYLNGEPAGYRSAPTIPLSSIQNVLSYIGRALYAPDPYLNGKIEEFRIYDHAFTAYEADASFDAGPDTLSPITSPAPDSIVATVSSPLYVGNVEPFTLTATYGTNVFNVRGEPGISVETTDTNVVSINAAGDLVASGLGTADITVSYQGQQSVVSVQVDPVPVPEAELKHRYSFNEPSTEFFASDSVSGADGMLVGYSYFTGEGEVEIPADPVLATYVDLPNGIISALTNASFEMWVTFDAEAGAWQRIFDFGNNTGGEDLQGTGTSYIFFSPRTGDAGPWRFEVKTPETPAYFWEGPGTLASGVEQHVAITYNALANVSRVYINGVLMASGTAPIPLQDIDDVNVWLGRSQFNDAGFDGKFDEFRIYEGVLTELQVLINDAAGPDTLVPDAGTLQSLSIDLPSTELTLGGLPVSGRVLANFTQVQGVNVTTLPGVSFTTEDTNVVEIADDGTITAVGEGTATLTAEYNGQQITAQVTVAAEDAVLALLHRYSFSEQPGSLVVEDTAGDADGTVIGNATFTGDGELSLPGGASTSLDAGYVDLPNGMISALPDSVTIESWVTWNGGGTWQRVWDFGNNVNGEGQQGTGDSTFFLTPQAGGANVVRAAFRPMETAPELPVLNGDAPLPTGTQSHVAVVYDYTSGVSRLYVDGVRVDTQPVTDPLSGMTDVNNWFGRSNWPDAYFNGLLNEIRIWSGAMSDAQVSARFAAGPDSLDEPVAEPELAISEAGGQTTISWPSTATGYQLEQTTELGPQANWTDVTQTVETSGGVNSVTITPTGDTRFFRLTR